jgi:hypothetical protein
LHTKLAKKKIEKRRRRRRRRRCKCMRLTAMDVRHEAAGILFQLLRSL